MAALESTALLNVLNARRDRRATQLPFDQVTKLASLVSAKDGSAMRNARGHMIVDSATLRRALRADGMIDVLTLAGPEPRVLGELYVLCEREREQKAIEFVLVHLERSLRRAQWRSVDDVMTRLDVSRLTPAVVVAVLSITFPAKAFLKVRSAFLERAEGFLSRSLGQERARALLVTRR
jgi:hypothetical protein